MNVTFILQALSTKSSGGVFAVVFDPLASGVQQLEQGDMCHRQIKGRPGVHDLAFSVHFKETCGRRAANAGFVACC